MQRIPVGAACGVGQVTALELGDLGAGHRASHERGRALDDAMRAAIATRLERDLPW